MSGVSITSMVVRLSTVISSASYPRKVNLRTSPSLTSSEYSPLKSVTVPVVVPLITILTPGNGSPLSADVTVPVSVTCEYATDTTPRNMNKKEITLFI